MRKSEREGNREREKWRKRNRNLERERNGREELLEADYAKMYPNVEYHLVQI